MSLHGMGWDGMGWSGMQWGRMGEQGPPAELVHGDAQGWKVPFLPSRIRKFWRWSGAEDTFELRSQQEQTQVRDLL